MAINYIDIGKRISNFRNKKGMSQEELGEKLNISREHISRIETGKRNLGLDALVDIANALGVSADDLLVDSLDHHVSTADSELHRLLLDCNKTEEEILTRNSMSSIPSRTPMLTSSAVSSNSATTIFISFGVL